MTAHIACCPALWCELLLFHSRGRRWFIHRRFIPWSPAPGSMLTGGLCGPCPGHSSAARPPVTFHYGRAGPQLGLSYFILLPAARPCAGHGSLVYWNPVAVKPGELHQWPMAVLLWGWPLAAGCPCLTGRLRAFHPGRSGVAPFT